MLENKVLAATFFKVADEGRTPVDLCAPDFNAYFQGPPPMDLQGFDRFESMFRSAFSNLRHRIEEVVAEGDGVAVRLTLEGTHTGDFMGVPGSGAHFSVEGTAFLRIAGGRITELRGFLDQAGLMQQIGRSPASAQAG